MLAKLATFERKPQVDYLFFGTSLTQDGIAPRLVSRHLQEISPELPELVGFNAAAPGASIDDLLTLAPRYLYKPSLRVVFIELSTPHFSNTATLPATLQSPITTVEGRLAAALQNIFFIKFRNAFRLGNLGSFISLLLFSSSMSGSEARLNDFIAAWTGKDELVPENFNESLWVPAGISTQNNLQPLDGEREKIAAKVMQLSTMFQAQGIKVILYAPPASADYLVDKNGLTLFYNELAKRSKAELWNFIGLPIPAHFFKDPTHLSKKEGQPHWSYAIASQLAKLFRTI